MPLHTVKSARGLGALQNAGAPAKWLEIVKRPGLRQPSAAFELLRTGQQNSETRDSPWEDYGCRNGRESAMFTSAETLLPVDVCELWA